MNAAGAAKCPICERPANSAHRPFCSKRCSQIDLFRWLGGHYRVPTDEAPEAPADTPRGENPAPDDADG